MNVKIDCYQCVCNWRSKLQSHEWTRKRSDAQLHRPLGVLWRGWFGGDRVMFWLIVIIKKQPRKHEKPHYTSEVRQAYRITSPLRLSTVYSVNILTPLKCICINQPSKAPSCISCVKSLFAASYCNRGQQSLRSPVLSSNALVTWKF